MPDIVFNENFNTMNIFVFIYMTCEDLSFYIISNFLDFLSLVDYLFFIVIWKTGSSQ
jgi:hypothetical protein